MSKRYSCVYNHFNEYNSNESPEAMRDIGISPPIPSGTPSWKNVIVPVWGSIGYDALTHGDRCTCGGHFTIENAYPNYKNNCTKFTKRLCSDN